MKKDIQDLNDIKLLVDTFYGEVQKDPLIGGIFIGAIKDWTVHLAKMYTFWQTVLFDAHTYQGRPFPPHAQLPIEAAYFDRWLSLWRATVDTYFEGKIAEDAKWRAEKMAELFLSKIEYFRQQGKTALI